MRKDIKHNKFVFCTVLLSFVLYLIRLMQNSNIAPSMDELGTLANVGYYAGLDWSDCVSHTRYYGGGFYWLYSFLVRLTDNPYFIVLAIYLLNSFLVSLTAGLIYNIMVKYLKTGDSWNTVIFSVLPCAFYHISAWTYISNETPLFLIYWFLIYFVINAYLCKNKKKRYWFSFLSAEMLSLTLTIHERAVAVWISIFAVILLFCLLFKERIVSFIVFFPTAIIGYCAARLYKGILIDRFWNGNHNLNNTSAFSGMKLWFLDGFDSLRILFDIFITNFLRLSMQTYGIIAVGTGCFLISLFYIICRRIRKGKKLYLNETGKIRLILFFYSFFAVVLVFGGLSVSWGKYINAVFKGDIQLGVYYRAYTYIRYYASFAGGMMVATCSLFKFNFCRKKLGFAGLVVFEMGMFYYFTFVHGYFSMKWNINRLVLYSFGQEELSFFNTKISFLIVVGVFAVIMYRQKEKLLPTVLLVLLLYSAIDEIELGKPSVSCSAAGASYSFIKELEAEGVKLEEIYVSSNPSVFQIMLNRYRVIYYGSPDETDNAVVLSNYSVKKEEKILNNIKEYYYMQLDDNEYLYVKGALVDTLIKLGYPLEN